MTNAPILFNPFDWFWVVGDDETRLWSSKTSSYVASSPEDTFPCTRIPSEADLTDVLATYGLPGPMAIVPKQVTLYQGRAMLIQVGMFDQVKEAVDAQGQNSLAYQAFEYANHWYRDSEFIASMAAGLGLSEAQIDALFIAASSVK
jgi:hypothetical protein